jgi:hypothetical protein
MEIKDNEYDEDIFELPESYNEGEFNTFEDRKYISKGWNYMKNNSVDKESIYDEVLCLEDSEYSNYVEETLEKRFLQIENYLDTLWDWKYDPWPYDEEDPIDIQALKKCNSKQEFINYMDLVGL